MFEFVDVSYTMFGLHCSCDKHPRFHVFENIDKEFLESGNYKWKIENSTTTVFLQSEWSKRQTSYLSIDQ